MAAVRQTDHIKLPRPEPLPQQLHRGRRNHDVGCGLEDQCRSGDGRQIAQRRLEEPAQLVDSFQRGERVVAVLGGDGRRVRFLDRNRGALDVLQQADVAHPAVVEAQSRVDDGDAGDVVAGRCAQGDGPAHGEPRHVAVPGPGGEFQIGVLEGPVPVLPAVSGQVAPVRAVSGEQRDGHGEALPGQVLGPRKDAQGAAGEAVADGHADARVAAVAGITERCGRQGSAASGHEPIVSLFRTKLTRVGCH